MLKKNIEYHENVWYCYSLFSVVLSVNIIKSNTLILAGGGQSIWKDKHKCEDRTAAIWPQSHFAQRSLVWFSTKLWIIVASAGTRPVTWGCDVVQTDKCGCILAQWQNHKFLFYLKKKKLWWGAEQKKSLRNFEFIQ